MKAFNKFLVLMFIFSFLFIVIVEGAGTTLRGDTLSYDGPGRLNNIDTIDLQNNALLIRDSSSNTILALFNADPLLPIITAQSMVLNGTFPNTTISFLGDVNNIDDINGFSRFSETNLNNGSGASAGFNGVNDLGFVVNFGIGSSNFMIGNESLPNQGAIASFSPTGFDFVNSLTGDWRWRNNPSGNLSVPIRETVMTLSNFGNLDIAGNFTGLNASVDYLNAEFFVKLGMQPVDSISGSIPCNLLHEGSLAYSNIDQEFYGCRDKSGGSQTDFEWKKLT